MQKVLDFFDKYNILAVSDCQGSCPCGKLYIFGIEFEFHCWRNSCKDCKYSGLHLRKHWDQSYTNEELLTIGNKVLEQLKEVWSRTDWELRIDKYD
jgi:hypothetical protein